MEPSRDSREHASPAPPAPLAPIAEFPAPQTADLPAPGPEWGLGKRILFRFWFSYLFLYIFPFPLDQIPYVAMITMPWYQLWGKLVPWVGSTVFQREITVTPNGSGDTTYNYVQIFCILVLAVVATLAWSVLDRRRTDYAWLHKWLRGYSRIWLATVMVSYGAYKVIPSQFPAPPLDRLLQPYGDSSPMGILWTFMGASAAYTIFTGASEMLGGLLLIARRTTLLGALVCIGVMGNVVMLNFSYDVPVKLYSSHLFAAAVFLALPDLRRLANFFVLNRRVEAAGLRPLFKRRWLNRGALALRLALVLFASGMGLWVSYQGRSGYISKKPPLYGIWEVEEFVADGQVRPPLVTDETRWRRVVFGYPGQMSIYLMSSSRQRFNLELDEQKKTMALAERGDPAQKKTSLTYRRPDPKTLLIEGTFDKRKIRVRARQIEEPKFLLTTRGFHWINEYPFNR